MSTTKLAKPPKSPKSSAQSDSAEFLPEERTELLGVPFAQVVSEWCEYLRAVRVLSPETVVRYRRRVVAFLGEVEDSDPGVLTGSDLVEHLKRLFYQGQGLPTRRLAYTACRSFGEFLAIQGICAVAPFSKVEGPPRQYRQRRKVLSTREVRRLIYGPRPGTLPDDPVLARNRVILVLMYWLGLRVSEVALRTDQLEPQKKGGGLLVTIREGKWAQEDQPLPLMEPLALRLLAAYVQEVRPKLVASDENSPWLFPSVCRVGEEVYKVRGGLRAGSVWRIVRAAFEDAEIEPAGRKLTPHLLRHTLASQLVEKGWDVRAVQEFLRHKSLETTQQYVHVREGRLRTLLRRRSPLG